MPTTARQSTGNLLSLILCSLLLTAALGIFAQDQGKLIAETDTTQELGKAPTSQPKQRLTAEEPRALAHEAELRAFADPGQMDMILNGEEPPDTNRVQFIQKVERMVFSAMDQKLLSAETMAGIQFGREFEPDRTRCPTNVDQCLPYTERLLDRLSQHYRLVMQIERLRCDLTRRLVAECQIYLRENEQMSLDKFTSARWPKSATVTALDKVVNDLEALANRPGFTTNALDVLARYFQAQSETN